MWEAIHKSYHNMVTIESLPQTERENIESVVYLLGLIEGQGLSSSSHHRSSSQPMTAWSYGVASKI